MIVKLSFIYILLFIFIFTSGYFAQSKEISTLYQWETSSGMEWVPIGADERQPKYEGEIINEEPNGIGALTYPGGHKYEGDWKDGEQHGRGTFTWSDGRKYTGIFRDGKPYGQGTYTNLDGTKTWGSGKLLKRIFSGSNILILLRYLIRKYPGYCHIEKRMQDGDGLSTVMKEMTANMWAKL